MFLSRIDETVRYEIARSAEQSYESLSIQDALEVFQLNNLNDLNKFIEKNS